MVMYTLSDYDCLFHSSFSGDVALLLLRRDPVIGIGATLQNPVLAHVPGQYWKMHADCALDKQQLYKAIACPSRCLRTCQAHIQHTMRRLTAVVSAIVPKGSR